ncbi:hypothetical protein C8R45DRAFT_1218338 [Mycena sanguinolenta]|nr:hypothetical protein C8R45DRAFT_1218338 [Mycena sanguinolenta]
MPRFSRLAHCARTIRRASDASALSSPPSRLPPNRTFSTSIAHSFSTQRFDNLHLQSTTTIICTAPSSSGRAGRGAAAARWRWGFTKTTLALPHVLPNPQRMSPSPQSLAPSPLAPPLRRTFAEAEDVARSDGRNRWPLTVVRTARALHGSAERPALRRSTDTVRAIVVLPHFRACRPTTHYGNPPALRVRHSVPRCAASAPSVQSDLLCAVAAAAGSESSAFVAAALREDDRDLLPGRRRPRHRSPEQEQEQELDRPRGRTSTSTRESRDERHGSIADSRRRPPPAVRASSPSSIFTLHLDFAPRRLSSPFPRPPSRRLPVSCALVGVRALPLHLSRCPPYPRRLSPGASSIYGIDYLPMPRTPSTLNFAFLSSILQPIGVLLPVEISVFGRRRRTSAIDVTPPMIVPPTCTHARYVSRLSRDGPLQPVHLSATSSTHQNSLRFGFLLNI